MKKTLSIFLCLVMLLGTVGCVQKNEPDNDNYWVQLQENGREKEVTQESVDLTPVEIVLSDEGAVITEEMKERGVSVANDIVFYLTNQGKTYGAGSVYDSHAESEAEEHSVVHITEPGTYILSGSIRRGQIAVDLGEQAKDDPNAVVTLVLNNANITCTVAPAIMFYNVYECGSADTETATAVVDTTAAGANIVIADGSENTILGSYVARIYKDLVLNDDGSVAEYKTLHKYDGAIYSRMSMNINGDTGKLTVLSYKEGIDSELHLTINGGDIHITSNDDGINTNEDNVSVTTINGGNLTIYVQGFNFSSQTWDGEGDGIDSNGWIVINGGTLTLGSCSTSEDAGLDSDCGTMINGGTVIATGHMNDRVSSSNQKVLVFEFPTEQKDEKTYAVKDTNGETIVEWTADNCFTYLVVSKENITEREYSVFCDGEIIEGVTQMTEVPMPVGERPERPEMPEGERPEPPEMPEGERSEAPEMPEGERPEAPEMPEGERPEPPEKPEG